MIRWGDDLRVTFAAAALGLAGLYAWGVLIALFVVAVS